jgi:gliding motility-associated-like protein/uncharacterized repeat protein (TIGR01451 family)
MINYRSYLLSSLLILLSRITLAQTFPCNGSLYISLHDNQVPPAVIHQITVDGDVVDFNQVIEYDITFNSVGYNPVDNFIYGKKDWSNEIIRLKSDGTYETVIVESSISDWVSGAGDVSKTGKYAIHERSNNRLYLYDLNTQTSIGSVSLFWHPSTGNSGIANLDLDDIVFSFDDPLTIITYQRNYPVPNEPISTRGHLLSIDVDPSSSDYGRVSTIGPIDESIVRHMGAMFFDSKGDLYGYGSVSTSPLVQERFFSIDKTNGDAELIGIGPSASYNDGCSCPYTIKLEKEISQDYINCFDEEIEFTFLIENNSSSNLTGIQFVDTLPGNIQILGFSPPNPMIGNQTPGTGIGTSIISFEEISIGAGEVVSFSVFCSLPLLSGAYENQAHLKKLPSLFGSFILSDDPITAEFNDPTSFQYATDIDLSNVDGIINHPVDCGAMNNGSILFTNTSLPPNSDFLFSYNLNGNPVDSVTITTDSIGQVFLSPLEEGIYSDFLLFSTQNATCTGLIPGSFLLELLPNPLSIDLFEQPVDCDKGSRGEIEAIVEGGSDQYFFDWDLQNNGEAILDSLLPGTYCVTVTDLVSACTIVSCGTIIQEDDFEVDFIISDLDCTGGTLGTIKISPENGSGQYLYFWDEPNNEGQTLLDSLFTGIYCATVTDQYTECSFEGCSSISQVGEISIDAEVEGVPCEGGTSGVIDLNVIGGSENIGVFWGDPVYSNSLHLENLGVGEYCVEVVDTFTFCLVEGCFGINVEDSLQITGKTDYGCFGDSLFLSVSGVQDSSIIFWTGPNGFIGSEEEILVSENASNFHSGIYFLDGYSKGCFFYDTVVVKIPKPVFVFISGDTLIEWGDPIILHATSNQPEDVVYQWTPEELVDCPNCTFTKAFPVESTTFTVRATDSLGCSDSDTLTIKLNRTKELYIPNVFSPNGDGFNDIFQVFSNAFVKEVKKLEIYDRWGELIFRQYNFSPNDRSLGWDGTFNGKPLNPSTFVYYIEVEFWDGTSGYKTGSINIIK